MNEPTLKDKTAKGLWWASISSGLQQFLSVVAGIIFARALSQDDYGIIGMLSVFVAVVMTIQEGGFFTGLINRKEIKHEDYNAVFWFSAVTGLVLYLILFFSAPLIADFFHEPALIPLSRVLSLYMLLASVSVAQNGFLVKQLKFKEIAIINFYSLLISNLIGIALILYGYSYWGLVVQMVCHSLLVSVLRWCYCPWKPSFTFNIQPLKEMLPFSIKLVLTGFANQINANILSVFFGRFYNKYEVGVYSQGNKWAGIVSAFVNNMINNVAQPIFVEANSRNHQQRIFRKMLRFTVFLSFPVMFGLAMAAPELIEILITDKWMSSVLVLQLFCIWGAFWPINTLYTQLIIAHGKSNIYLWNTIAMGVTQIIVLFCIRSMGITAMVVAFLMINFLWLGIWHYQAQRLTGVRAIEVLKDSLPYLAITAVALGCSYFISLYINNIYGRCLQKISVVVFIYVALMWKTNSVIFKESVNYVLGLIV